MFNKGHRSTGRIDPVATRGNSEVCEDRSSQITWSEWSFLNITSAAISGANHTSTLHSAPCHQE
jgi:hypothetical protein